MSTPIYQRIASLLEARANCEKSGNGEWFDKHTASLEQVSRESLPSGSGIDNGSYIDFTRSSAERIVLLTGFHHMDQNGSYDGWTEHTVIVTPSLAHGITLKVTGRDRNQIKEYIGEVFHDALTR